MTSHTETTKPQVHSYKLTYEQLYGCRSLPDDCLMAVALRVHLEQTDRTNSSLNALSTT